MKWPSPLTQGQLPVLGKQVVPGRKRLPSTFWIPQPGSFSSLLRDNKAQSITWPFHLKGGCLRQSCIKGGIRPFNDEGELTAKGDHYETKGMKACFDPSGSLLATTSMDGLVRLHEIKDLWGQRDAVVDIRPASTFRPQAGKVPVGIAFSPEGSKLAVGFLDIAKLEVLELRTTTLSHGFVPDCSGIGRS